MKAAKERSALRRSIAKSTTGSVESRLSSAMRYSGFAGSIWARLKR